MADVHWADRHAVDGTFIREVLLRERNEVTASDVRDRRIASDYRTRGSAHRLRIVRVIDDAGLRLNGATGEAPAAGRSGEHRGDEFAAATDAGLVEYRLEVILNGVFGDVQRGRDNAGRGSA